MELPFSPVDYWQTLGLVRLQQVQFEVPKD